MAIFFQDGGGCSCSREICDESCQTYVQRLNTAPMLPTRRCVFCGKLENNSDVIKDETWICLDCAKLIGKLIGANADD